MKKLLYKIIVSALFFVQLAPVSYADTLTVYPNPHTETTSFDGYSGINTGSGSSWASAHDAATGNEFNDDSAQAAGILSRENSSVSNQFEIARGFFLFDTSALTSAATISAGTMSLWGDGKSNTDNDGQDYVNIYTTTPASNTALANADFDQIGTTAQATAIDLGSIPANDTGYTDWTLNATGLGNISKTSITKFGAREGHDAENAAIATDGFNRLVIYFAENTGTSKDPKLVITYTSARRRVILTK